METPNKQKYTLLRERLQKKCTPKQNTSATLTEIDIDKISPNPYQPRKTFLNIEELASSIKEKGLLQAITVTKLGENYTIIAGERRFRAYQFLAKDFPDFKKIKANILNDISIEDLKLLAIIENVQREDMNILEISNSYKMLSEDNLSLREIAKFVGKSKTTIARYLKIAEIPKELKYIIEVNNINSPVSIEQIVDSGLDIKTQKKILLKVANGANTSTVKSIVEKLKKAPKSKNTSKTDKYEDIFTRAMAPVKKREYLALSAQKRILADKILQNIAIEKEKLSKLLSVDTKKQKIQ